MKGVNGEWAMENKKNFIVPLHEETLGKHPSRFRTLK